MNGDRQVQLAVRSAFLTPVRRVSDLGPRVRVLHDYVTRWRPEN